MASEGPKGEQPEVKHSGAPAASTSAAPTVATAVKSETPVAAAANAPADTPARVASDQDNATIEAEDNDSAVDPGEFEPVCDWDAQSSASTSITSSVYAYEFENGRRFHSYKHGRYPVPNDDQEQSREDMKHAMLMELTV